MPQVIHSFRGDNRQPRLKLPKGERAILENAAGLCRAIESACAGHNEEISVQAGKLAGKLMQFAEIEEMDLTKPW